MFNHFFVNDPLPPSFSKESQMAQLRRMLELRVNPIDGLSSKWDYDNDRWKNGTYFVIVVYTCKECCEWCHNVWDFTRHSTAPCAACMGEAG
ncbi:unnamed protein product [Leptidea sinapis]|uniref:Cytochrome c oxidase subunit 4 n=1 Tax=Leptidea sinapis TaxID=189913 RepID=A0A5E4PXP0_9NEOP|nr:unnamed protein product [Leptidea sinapis]